MMEYEYDRDYMLFKVESNRPKYNKEYILNMTDEQLYKEVRAIEEGELHG